MDGCTSEEHASVSSTARPLSLPYFVIGLMLLVQGYGLGGDAGTAEGSATSDLPDDFWPSIDAWYWGGSCYVCRLASELVRLRIERHRVHQLLVSQNQHGKLEVMPEELMPQWRDAVCDDVVTLLVDASAELAGSFLRDLASLLTDDHARLRLQSTTRHLILDWLKAFIQEPEHLSATLGAKVTSRQWPQRYREALQNSTWASCSRAWGRHILPMHRSSARASSAASLSSGCPCSDESHSVYQQLEQNRAWMTAIVNPSLSSWGLCEHLSSIIDGMRVLHPLLPANAASNDQVLIASCALAQSFARPAAVWNGFADVRKQPPSGEHWFRRDDTVDAGPQSASDCLKLATEISSDLRFAVHQARGMVSSSRSAFHGKDLCQWLSAVPLATQGLKTHVSIGFWYFASEGLIESMGEGSAQYRAVVPFKTAQLHTYVGPWRSMHASAIRDRKSLHTAFTLLGGNSSRLLHLLAIVDDTLLFYRDMGIAEQDHDIREGRASQQPAVADENVISEGAAFTDIQEVLEQQDMKWEQDMFESLERRAAALVIKEFAALQLPFLTFCTKLEESTISLRWIGRPALLRWCRPDEPVVQAAKGSCPNEPSVDNPCPEVACECGNEVVLENSTTTLAPEPLAPQSCLSESVHVPAQDSHVYDNYEVDSLLRSFTISLSGWLLAAAMGIHFCLWRKSDAATALGGAGPPAFPPAGMLPVVDLPGILAMAHRERIVAAAQARPMSCAAPAA